MYGIYVGSLQVMAAEESVDLLQLEKPVNLRKMRLFYMEGLKTPYAQSISSECYDALKRVRTFVVRFSSSFHLYSNQENLEI